MPVPENTSGPSRVLVTGAAGFVGANLVRSHLARGDDVRCFVHCGSSAESLGGLPVELVCGDVTNLAGLQKAVCGVDRVYHLAGVISCLRAEQFYQVNTQGMTNIARACAAQTNPPTLVVVSSIGAAGVARHGRPLRESDPPRPVSHYGRSKRAGELALHALAGAVPITVVRPPIIFGPYDRRSVPLFRTIRSIGITLIPGLQRLRYSLIHADDLARLLMLAADRGERLSPLDADRQDGGRGYYFAAGEFDPWFEQYANWIAQSVGRRRVLSIPTASFLIWIVGTVAEVISRLGGRAAYLNRDKVAEMLAGSWICSAQKAVAHLGFSLAAPLPRRFAETARWYQQHGWI